MTNICVAIHNYTMYLIRISYICITGALFTEDEKDGSSELAFKYAVYRINKDRTLLANITLIYDIQYVPREDSFHAAKKGNTFGKLFHSVPPIAHKSHLFNVRKAIISLT